MQPNKAVVKLEDCFRRVRTIAKATTSFVIWCMCDRASLVFINIFKSPYMFRAKNSPILRSNFCLYIQLLVLLHCTGRQQYRCTVPNAVYTDKKRSWGWANLSPETCRAGFKTLINEKICCILLVTYVVIASSCLSVCLSVPPHGTTLFLLDEFSYNIYIWVFCENLLRKFMFYQNLTRITGTLHEYVRTFTIIPR